MKVRLRIGLLLWVALIAVGAVGDEAPLSREEYKARLQHYLEQVQETEANPAHAIAFYNEVPPSLRVQTPSGVVSVSLDFLRRELAAVLKGGPHAKPGSLAPLRNHLEDLEDGAEGFEQANPGDAAARDRLNRILSAGEFRRVSGPTGWELLWQRINAWLDEFFKKHFPKAPDLNQAGQIFVWVMIGIASCVLAVWLYRQARQQIVDPRREILPFMPSARGWRAWLADARTQAGEGHWREAIRMGFWAGVSRLESQGIWRPDKARTPREYLKAIPADSESKPAFAATVRTFEEAWYGERASSAKDFEQFVTELERLGCRE